MKTEWPKEILDKEAEVERLRSYLPGAEKNGRAEALGKRISVLNNEVLSAKIAYLESKRA